jgi:uncharacterized protein (TIGR03435 family)
MLRPVSFACLAASALAAYSAQGQHGRSASDAASLAFEAASVAFEAASVKVTASPDNGFNESDTNPGRLTLRNVSLRWCIRFAYGVQDFQISGGPKWLDHDRYDIDGKAAGPAKTPELRLMLQSLLAERFRLVLHRESRLSSGYALVVAKGGLKLKPREGAAPAAKLIDPVSPFRNVRMTGLASYLGRSLRVPVADATNVTGVFDFDLGWTPERGVREAAEAMPSIFEALEELGLKLEPRKEPLEVIVVDSAEKASEN